MDNEHIEINLSREQYNRLLYLMAYATAQLRDNGEAIVAANGLKLAYEIQKVAVIKEGA